jgi:hypothetical protein
MHWILNLDILLLVSGIARKHGIVPKPFLGHPQYFSPPKKIHFLPRTRDFSRKRVCGFSNRQLQENIFNRANLFGGAIFMFPPFNPPNPVSSCCPYALPVIYYVVGWMLKSLSYFMQCLFKHAQIG